MLVAGINIDRLIGSVATGARFPDAGGCQLRVVVTRWLCIVRSDTETEPFDIVKWTDICDLPRLETICYQV